MFHLLVAPLLAAATPQGLPVGPVPALQQPAAAESILALDALLAEVVERNPALAALDQERAAALDRAVAAGAFPHPVVGFALRNVPVDSFSLSEDMMTMREVMVRQQIPWFGKRALRREVVAQNAALAEAERAAQRLVLLQATTDAYANLWLAAHSEGLVREQERALQRFAQIARGGYAAGRGSQSDLLRADMELARIQDPLRELEEMELAARAALATLLARPLDALEGTPADLPLPALPDDPAPLYARVEQHPELLALEEQARRSDAEARLAQRDRWPDPEVGLAYGQRAMAPDMVGAEVMFRIPVFAGSNEDRLAAAATAEARAARARRDGQRDALLGEARVAWAAAQRQRHLVRLFEEEVVPRARRNLESSTGAYQVGAVDFLTLLDAQVQLQTVRLEALRARANYLRQVARLSRALGVSLLSNDGTAEVHHG